MSYYQYTCDHALEQKYAAILDHDLYIESMGFTNSHRNVDRNTQKLGVDIEFDFAGRHYVCDEKAATSYGVNVSDNSGRTLSTYSFELFTTEGPTDYVGKKGWFVDERILTDSYMLNWIDEFTTDGGWRPIKAFYALVSKKSMMSELSRKWPLGPDRIADRCCRIVECWKNHGYSGNRSDSVRRGQLTRFHGEILLRDASEHGPYFSANTTGGQFHVNLVVPRKILNRIADRHGCLAIN